MFACKLATFDSRNIKEKWIKHEIMISGDFDEEQYQCFAIRVGFFGVFFGMHCR